MKRLTAPLAAVIALSASCSSSPEAIVVGAVYPTAGSQGMGGVEEFRGVRLAADLVNREGGVLGRPIRLMLEPAHSADGAPEAVNRAVEAGAAVVVGSYGSTISAPAAEAASRLQAVFWETGAVGDVGEGTAPGSRFFRAVSTGETLGESAVSFIRDQIIPRLGRGGDPKYAVAYVDDPYGRPVGSGALREIEESGVPLAGTFPYDLQSVDYTRLARAIRKAGTDVLVVAAYLEDGIELRRALVREDVPLLASIGTSSSYCMMEFEEHWEGKLWGSSRRTSRTPSRSIRRKSLLRPGRPSGGAARNTVADTARGCPRLRFQASVRRGGCSGMSCPGQAMRRPTPWPPRRGVSAYPSDPFQMEAVSVLVLQVSREAGRT